MKLTYYKDKSGKWRWRINARNGEIIAAATEGFSNRVDMLANISLTFDSLKYLRDQWWGDLNKPDDADTG